MPDKKNCPPNDDCLTPADRALLNAVFGWAMPGAASIPWTPDEHGTQMLRIARDRLRHGEDEGTMTGCPLATNAAMFPRSPVQGLLLSAKQIARGLRHLARSHATPSLSARVGGMAGHVGARRVAAAVD